MVLGSNYHLCLGQKRGFEYAIQTLRDQYRGDILIDSGNAFNSLNQSKAGIEKHQKYMPIAVNSYQKLVLKSI